MYILVIPSKSRHRIFPQDPLFPLPLFLEAAGYSTPDYFTSSYVLHKWNL